MPPQRSAQVQSSSSTGKLPAPGDTSASLPVKRETKRRRCPRLVNWEEVCKKKGPYTTTRSKDATTEFGTMDTLAMHVKFNTHPFRGAGICSICSWG